MHSKETSFTVHNRCQTEKSTYKINEYNKLSLKKTIIKTARKFNYTNKIKESELLS